MSPLRSDRTAPPETAHEGPLPARRDAAARRGADAHARAGDPPGALRRADARRSRSRRSPRPSELRPDEVLVWVMAAGINYNNVWAGLGVAGRRHQGARSATRTGPTTQPFHIGGSDASGIVWKVGSAVTQREGRRRGRHPLRHVEGRRPVRQGRQRSDVRPELPHLGLRDQLGQLRAVHARAGAPVPAEAAQHLTWDAAAAYMLVGATAYRMLDELAAAHGAAGRRRPRLGRRRRPRLPGDPDREGGGRHPGRRHLERRQDRVLQAARRQGLHQPQAASRTGACCRTGRTTKAYGEWAKGARAFGAAALGGGRRAEEPAHRLRASRARTPCRRRSSSATRAAWS